MGLALTRVLSPLLPLAYLIQPLEVAWGILRPAKGTGPENPGLRLH